MLLLTLQQQQQQRTQLGHTLVPHEILVVSATISASLTSLAVALAVPLTVEAARKDLSGTVEEPGVTASSAPPTFLALPVPLAIPLPAPARIGFIFGGLSLRVEPLNPVSKSFVAKMGVRKNALGICLVINNSVPRGPGTALRYMFVTNELHSRMTATAFMELDGKTALGCKMQLLLDLRIRFVETDSGVRVETLEPIMALSMGLGTQPASAHSAAPTAPSGGPIDASRPLSQETNLLQQFLKFPARIKDMLLANGGGGTLLGALAPPVAASTSAVPPVAASPLPADGLAYIVPAANSSPYLLQEQEQLVVAVAVAVTFVVTEPAPSKEFRRARRISFCTGAAAAKAHVTVVVAFPVPVPFSRKGAAAPGVAIPLAVLAPGTASASLTKFEFRLSNLPPFESPGDIRRFESLFTSRRATAKIRRAKKSSTATLLIDLLPSSVPRMVAMHVLRRSGYVIGGHPVRVEPMDSFSQWVAPSALNLPPLVVYLAVNPPQHPATSSEELSRAIFKAFGVWPYMDRGLRPVPGTRLWYMYLTFDAPRGSNELKHLDELVAFGCKMRFFRIEDPRTFFANPKYLFDRCTALVGGDPDLAPLLNEDERTA
ncbi:hypothetical protein GGF31_001266 [Allomyces arbusculus]|nr:hypothetical protein GGF31_001266 [Allomyces arbusculus]